MVRTFEVVGCLKIPRRGTKVVPTPTTEGVFTIDMSSTSTLDIATVSQGGPPAAPEMQARHNFFWHLLVDLPILIFVGAACILLEVGSIPSRRAGFTCNDPALAFPYEGDTFSISLVAAITVIVPFLVMWAVETISYRHDEYNLKKNKLLQSAKIVGLIYRDYMYGAVVTLTVLEVVKCMVGSPRPTFFDICQPDRARTCNGSEFVRTYRCESTKYSKYLVIDSSRSFPSAHASLSLYCGLFVAWYLQRRAFSWRARSALATPLLQLACAAYAAAGALSRLTDRRHHWWDVLAGAALGVLAALYTILVLCKNFSRPAVASSSDISSGSGGSGGAPHAGASRRLLGAAAAP